MSALTVRIGARKSRLSQVQVAEMTDLLRCHFPDIVIEQQTYSTEGDRNLDRPLPEIGGKGVFTAEIDYAILASEIDLAVHSLKDLPVESSPGIAIAAIPCRASTMDMLLSRQGWHIDSLPPGAAVGTSSSRRAAQLLHYRPDLQPVSIRGNVGTRIRKLLTDGEPYDAIILAKAGLDRLSLTDVPAVPIPSTIMLPAPGQGALAIQCRTDAPIREMLAPLCDIHTTLATTAERSFLSELGGGCAAPVAASASIVENHLTVHGRVLSLDGTVCIDQKIESPARSVANATETGRALANLCMEQGASALLKEST